MASWLKSSGLRDLAEHRWGPAASWHCVYCGRSTPDGAVDHFVPRERGGVDLPWNLVPSCHVCNRAKADHDPLRWMEAVEVPQSTIDTLHRITQSPAWTSAADYRVPRYARLDYDAGDRMPESTLHRPLPQNLAEVFVLDPSAWAPATALRRIAAAHLVSAGRPPISTQQLNRDLESRGLVRTKRRGIFGYRGIYVTPEAAEAGRYVAGPADTARARRRARQQDEYKYEHEWAYRAGFWRAPDND